MDNMGNDISYIDLCDSPEEWRELLRIWRNKPRIRSEMVFQEEISPEQHTLWLKKVLSSDGADKIRIAVSNGVPFGIVRLMDIDRNNCSSNWGLYIGEEQFLGRGFGKKILMYLIEWAFEEEELRELHTKVNKKNAKGIGIYENAGFQVTGETEDFYTMSLENTNNESKIWTVGRGGNGREMPLELKRRFAWVFASGYLPKCIENGAVIEIKSDSEDVYLKWRDIVFKIDSQSDIGNLAEKIPYVDITVPKKLSENCDWGFIAFDTKDDMGFSALYAASMDSFKRIITFCDNTANFMLNEGRSKIEILDQEHKDNMENLRSNLDGLPVFAEFSLLGVENPLELAEKINNSGYIKGISVRNNLPAHEVELPEKIAEIIENSEFKGSIVNKVFVGYRE